MPLHCILIHLDIDGPLKSTGYSERSASDRVFHVAEDEQVKEEPTNHLHQLIVPPTLALVH